MRVVNAIWEKENIGVDCTEILITHEDTIENLSALKEINTDYIVIKLDIANSKLIQPVQALGFKVIEVQHVGFHDNNIPKLPSITSRLATQFTYEIASDEDTELIIQKISDGMFTADRIATDNRFSIAISANRYSRWASHLFKNNAKPYMIKYKNRNIGFFIHQNDGAFNKGLLGGLFEGQNIPSAGIFLNYLQIVKTFDENKKGVWMSFSSNNHSLYSINSLLQCSFENSYYVFTNN